MAAVGVISTRNTRSSSSLSLSCLFSRSCRRSSDPFPFVQTPSTLPSLSYSADPPASFFSFSDRRKWSRPSKTTALPATPGRSSWRRPGTAASCASGPSLSPVARPVAAAAAAVEDRRPLVPSRYRRPCGPVRSCTRRRYVRGCISTPVILAGVLLASRERGEQGGLLCVPELLDH